MSETLEQRALRLAADLESRDLEAAEALRALVRRQRGPHTENLVCYITAHRRAWPGAVSVQVPADLADGFIAEHEPARPAPRIRGDSRTDDAGRWSGLESGVDT